MRGAYEREEFRERQAWERTRWQTCLLLNIQLTHKDKLLPTDLIEFEWERKERLKKAEKVSLISREELERIKTMYD
jgi:hypothetical protein